jgi:cytochrome b subunit of formate dehydrogenase
LVAALFAAMPAARAADPENCLLCHRYRGLSRVDADTGQIRLFYVNPGYYDHELGPHARLKCTDCHRKDEVGVIPHKPLTRVDCTTACHIRGANDVELTFSHQGIETALTSSVHNSKNLGDANQLLGEPLAPGQAQCLLCHDEPTFRWSGSNWAHQQASISRCNVCHTEELPKDTQYYYWHVEARSRAARSSKDLVRVCATCHSNPKVQDRFQLPDTAASYLASFHGKAMLLGSRDTANCLDCHVAELANVHLMKAKDEAGSPTSPQHLPDTCRSAACHPTAGHAISTAAIHLDLATSRGLEYFIGAIFFLMILSTFGPSVMILALELLQIVVARHEPDHHRNLALAERVVSDPRGRQKLKRFNPHQRVQHWILFASFTSLVITGFPLKFADHAWAAWMITQIGSIGRARLIHRWAGVILIAGFSYHMLYILVHTIRTSRQTGRGFIRTFLALPMVMQPEDFVQMRELMKFLFFMRKTRPAAGRFSLEEKFEYFGVFWGSMLLGVTGILMWANAWTSGLLTGRVLTLAALIHTFEAFLALLHVGIVHMISVIFSPIVFPLSPAMFTGDTPTEELAEGHSGMVEQVAQELKLALPPGEAGHG